MKKPRISFNKQSILAFLVNHGEKLVAGLFGLFACTLAWGGVEALRSMRPSQEQRPEAILEQSKSTDTHIDSVKIAPDDELTSEKGLSAKVKPWLSVKIDPPTQPLILNKPLFAELSKRTSPDILPIEDLRATAGAVVIATKPAPAGGRPVAGDKPTELDATAAAAPPKGQKPGRGGGRGPQPGPGMLPPGMQGMPPGPAEMPGAPGMPADPGMGPNQAQAMGVPKLLPYVIVTGLIPVKKQFEEYDRRFQGASLRDPSIDTPRWSSYQIERSEVLPGAAEKWVPIDMKAVFKQYSAQWLRLHPEPGLAPLTLPPELELRDKPVSPIPFCSPLPQLADGAWGFKGLHPWFIDLLQRDAAAKKAKEKAAREAVPDDVFGDAAQRPGGPMMPDAAMVAPGIMPGAAGMMPDGAMGPGGVRQFIDGIEYRLFRFVDLSVLPGRKYQYRARLVCWNPNANLPTRHLADVALAKKTTLVSPASDATAPTLVPDGKQLLAMPMKKDFLKKLKPGLVPIMALGEKPKGGSLALRALIVENGGLANVDPKSNKKGDPRSFGDALVTDRVLLDSRGDRQDRAEIMATTAAAKLPPPPEPFEMIFLRPDGTFEFTSTAEAQSQIDRYRPTAPPELGLAPPQGATAQPAAGEPSPFGNLFGAPTGSPPR